MAVLEIVRMGNPVLRQEARDLSVEEIKSEGMQSFVADLWDTVREANGLGLAAPQVGESIKVCVIDFGDDNPRYDVSAKSTQMVLFNPKITPKSDKTVAIYEGCLSVPGLRGLVPRCQDVEVSYIDEHGQNQVINATDMLAIVFQHEIDHLYGKLYVDRMQDMSTLTYEEELQQFHLPQ